MDLELLTNSPVKGWYLVKAHTRHGADFLRRQTPADLQIGHTAWIAERKAPVMFSHARREGLATRCYLEKELT